MCPLMSCTCSECRQCVSMTCGVISVKRCSSEVHGQNLTPRLCFGCFACTLRPERECSHFSANTTRIFEGSRIVKTGMVSGSAEIELFFVAVCQVMTFPVSFSRRFPQSPLQTWLPSALVPLLGRPLASISPLSPWQQGWAPPPVPARRQWRQW